MNTNKSPKVVGRVMMYWAHWATIRDEMPRPLPPAVAKLDAAYWVHVRKGWPHLFPSVSYLSREWGVSRTKAHRLLAEAEGAGRE